MESACCQQYPNRAGRQARRVFESGFFKWRRTGSAAKRRKKHNSGVINCWSSDAGNWTVCPVAHRTITCRTLQGVARLADSFLQPQQEESGPCFGVCGRLSECQTVAPQATTLTVSASANRMNCNVIMDQYAPLSQNCNIIVTQLSHKRKNRICWPLIIRGVFHLFGLPLSRNSFWVLFISKRQRTGALQNASRRSPVVRERDSVLDCSECFQCRFYY